MQRMCHEIRSVVNAFIKFECNKWPRYFGKGYKVKKGRLAKKCSNAKFWEECVSDADKEVAIQDGCTFDENKT